jgi:molybdopterin synthase catalytic subunit
VLKEKFKNILDSTGRSSFVLTTEEINTSHLRLSLNHPGCGGFVVFEGVVRDFNEGKIVIALEYEAYAELVQNEAEKIFSEIRERFQCRSVTVVHRTGRLSIGDIAVWVGVNSVHRGSAFDACQYMIDELKVRLPIWKKEFYKNSESSWVNCQACSSYVSKDLGRDSAPPP